MEPNSLINRNDAPPFLEADFMGVHLIGGYQFWSNPSRFGTIESIPTVLLNPTLLDILYLCQRYGGDLLLNKNQLMHSEGRITDSLFFSNQETILSCMKGLEFNDG